MLGFPYTIERKYYDHPPREMAYTFQLLGVLEASFKNYYQSKEALQEALRIQEKYYNDQH